MPSHFTKSLHPHLEAGLRPFSRMRTRGRFLTSAKNLVIKDGNIEAFSPINNPFAGLSVSWPFPQLIRGEHKTYLFHATSIEEVNESTWARTPLVTYDQENANATKAITSGGQWHFVDLKNSWYAFNGQCTVFQVGLDELSGLSEKVFVQDTVTIETGCQHEEKGQTIFVGGFDSSNFWSNWDDFLTSLSVSGIETSFDDVGQNYILQSSFGGGDFPLWLFHPKLSGYTFDLSPEEKEYIFNVLRRNEFSLRPLSFQGKVLRLAPLGDHIIAYQEDGVTALTFGETYKPLPLIKVGVDGRSAVLPGKERHFFLDTKGLLWSIGKNLEISRLGYEEFFSASLGEDHNFFEDPEEKVYYFNSPSVKVVLGSVFSTHEEEATSGAFIDGTFQGVSSTISDTEFLLKTTSISFERPGFKTITGVSVYGKYPFGGKLRISYRARMEDGFSNTAWKPLNRRGFAAFEITGVEFEVALRFPSYSGVEVDGMEVTYQPLDRTFVRGPRPQEQSLG